MCWIKFKAKIELLLVYYGLKEPFLSSWPIGYSQVIFNS